MALTIESALRKDKRTAQGGRVDGMQHRHFAFIAATLASLKPAEVADDHVHYAWENAVDVFAAACRRANPRFDRARFLRACGVEL